MPHGEMSAPNTASEIVDLNQLLQEVTITRQESREQSFLQDESVDVYCKRAMNIIRFCQKCSNDLQGWQHYSDFSGVQFTMTRIDKLLHGLISKVFSHQDIKLNISGYKLSEQFDIIREGNDALFEKINSDLDEAFGIGSNNDIEIVDSTVRTIRGPVNEDTGREMVLLASRNVQKPQLFFSPRINNSDKEPFIPFIKEKPNNIKPLSVMICLNADGREYYSHPYEYELQHWNPPEELLVNRDPVPPLPMSETPFLLVDDEQSLYSMVEELKKVKEVAVDLEHHSFRTYQGLTCLIQISTREKDFIVDPFPIRNQLPLLNEVFTDPKITKVFHGADYDILWLQRDCGVYVVNMFDTHQAAIVLEYPHRSLANLLHCFCQVSANKIYQRADWRIRPLPEDFVSYARQDSHYLLYVHDIMKNELIEKGNELNNLLHATYNRSMELCMKRYEKPIVGPDSHIDLYRKSRKHFQSRQMYALQHIYLWRDKIARQQDESVDYVLPKHMMLQMVEIMPKEMQGILACCNPIPPLVKTEQLTLHQIIRAARNLPLEEIDAEVAQLQPNPLSQMLDASDTSSSLVCRHDLSLIEEDPSGLSTILNPQETLLGDLSNQHSINIALRKNSLLFGVRKESLWRNKNELNKITEEFMSPYERYKIFTEYQRAEEEEEQEQQQQQEQEQQPQPEMAPPVTNEMRIEKVKAHFLSLSRSSTSDSEKKTESESDSDLDRLIRLQKHIASLTTDSPENTPKPPNKKKNKTRLSLKAKAQKREDAKINANKTASNKSATNNLKRRSSEGVDDVTSKKIKSENEDENVTITDEEENELKEKLEEIEPFDYSQANYNIFRPKNTPKRKRQNIKQKFRAKGSNKSSGWKKSGNKSISWGRVGEVVMKNPNKSLK